MACLRVFLFGRFCAQRNGQVVIGLDAQKVRELFCYLLLHRDRPHAREKLASTLWQQSSPSHAKQYLRQTLWKLQSCLCDDTDSTRDILCVESDWIRVQITPALWVDVEQFEQPFVPVRELRGTELNAAQAHALQQAVALYRGDLLENWYQDWCLFERERLQNIYLTMLYKLMGYCEGQGEYEQGIDFGARILRCDWARERAHCQLMRLRYFAGDRTGALRQYQRCVSVLHEELGVEPTQHTVVIYHQIQADQLPRTLLPPAEQPIEIDDTPQSLPEMLNHLRQLRNTLVRAQHQIERNMDVVKTMLKERH